jgi:hypothetical protein
MATAALRSNEMGVRSRSFTILPTLQPLDRILFHAINSAAEEGKQVGYRDLCEVTGITYQYGTLPGMIDRLRSEGLVEHVLGHRLQRGLWLKVIETGKCTGEPRSKAKHFRDITDRAPTPAIHHIRQRDMSLATWIETEARLTNRDHLGFLEELVRRGAQDYRAEKELAS